MNREEITNILRKIKPGAELAALPTEGALECTYITSLGVFFEWIPLDGWQFYKVNNIDHISLSKIIEKAKLRNLSIADIKNTWLGELYDSELGGEIRLLNDFFSNITSLNPANAREVYVHVRDVAAHFYATRIEFEAELESHLSSKVLRWEDMSDDELAQWVEKVTKDTPSFPMIEIYN